MKQFLNIANGEKRYNFSLDASHDVRKAKTVMDASIRGKNAFTFNVDGIPDEAIEEQAKKESDNFVQKAGKAVSGAFQSVFGSKSKYKDLRTDTQKRADQLGGIWTDTRPIYNGVSPFNTLMKSGLPGGEIYRYLQRNGRQTYTVPLVNVIAASRLGTNREGYELISPPVLAVASAFIEWCRIIYGDDLVVNKSLAEVDRNIIAQFKKANPELKQEVEKIEANNEKQGGASGMGDALMYVVIAAVVILLITKFV